MDNAQIGHILIIINKMKLCEQFLLVSSAARPNQPQIASSGGQWFSGGGLPD